MALVCSAALWAFCVSRARTAALSKSSPSFRAVIGFVLSGGDPTPLGDSAGSTDLLITWLYKLTVDKQDYNLGAVIGIMTFVVLAVVSLITYRNSGSYKNEEAFR